jgi:tRNA A37 threonylcarbamoyladenosine dehydratase
MGAGAKMDPSQVRIADISKTCNCALAKAVRKRLRGLGVNKGIPVVFSTEIANPDAVVEVEGANNANGQRPEPFPICRQYSDAT